MYESIVGVEKECLLQVELGHIELEHVRSKAGCFIPYFGVLWVFFDNLLHDD